MKTFVVGDIHGNHRALLQCLERSKFDYEKDRLIVLGDVCDGYPDVRECVDELLKISYCDFIIGNHDVWALEWARHGTQRDDWLKYGGANTIRSYGEDGMPQKHIDFIADSNSYILEEDRLFVHGGIKPNQPLEQQSLDTFTWDRDLFLNAAHQHTVDRGYTFGSYREIYIGHTTTQTFDSLEPMHICNIWAMDTGAGWSGKLTIMNVETKKFWQSDLAPELYPEEADRR